MPRRQVNNVARLDRANRLRVYGLLLDGYTYEEIRTEMEAAGIGLTLHNNSLLVCQDGDEFKRFRDAWTARQQSSEAYAVAAALADPQSREGASAETEDELLALIRRMISDRADPDDENALDDKALKMLAGALKDLAAIRVTTRVRKAEAEIERLKNELAAQKSAYEGQICELKARLAEMASAGGSKGLSEKTLRDIEEKARLL